MAAWHIELIGCNRLRINSKMLQIINVRITSLMYLISQTVTFPSGKNSVDVTENHLGTQQQIPGGSEYYSVCKN